MECPREDSERQAHGLTSTALLLWPYMVSGDKGRPPKRQVQAMLSQVDEWHISLVQRSCNSAHSKQLIRSRGRPTGVSRRPWGTGTATASGEADQDRRTCSSAGNSGPGVTHIVRREGEGCLHRPRAAQKHAPNVRSRVLSRHAYLLGTASADRLKFLTFNLPPAFSRPFLTLVAAWPTWFEQPASSPRDSVEDPLVFESQDKAPDHHRRSEWQGPSEDRKQPSHEVSGWRFSSGSFTRLFLYDADALSLTRSPLCIREWQDLVPAFFSPVTT